MCGSAASRSSSSAVSRDLPIPASPDRSTSVRSPTIRKPARSLIQIKASLTALVALRPDLRRALRGMPLGEGSVPACGSIFYLNGILKVVTVKEVTSRPSMSCRGKKRPRTAALDELLRDLTLGRS